MPKRLIRYAPYLVLGVAFLVRLVHIFQIDASPLFGWPVVDGKTYVEQAATFAGGDWLGAGEAPYWRAPLYGWLLGLTAGIFNDSLFYAARVVQAALGAATCWFAFDLGRRIFRVEVGLVAGLITALYGPLIYFDAEILPTSLAIFLDMWGLYLLIRALEDPLPKRFFQVGLVFGIASLAVATVLTFVAAAAVWIAWAARQSVGGWKEPVRRAAIFAAGVALVIAPVTLRNYTVGRDTVLISWNGGVNFYIGNNAEYERIAAVRAGWDWTDFVTRPDREGITRASEKSSYFFGAARDYITSDPVGWVGLQLKKTAEFWRGDEIGRNQPLYYWRNFSSVLAATMWKRGLAFPFGLLVPLALMGIALAIRRKEAWFPLFFVLVYSSSVILFFPSARYRLPVLPVLAVFAAWGAVWLYQEIRARRAKTIGAGLAALVALSLAANIGLPPMEMDGNAEVHYHLGDAHLRAGHLDLAQASFTRVLELDPEYWEARFNIGTIRGMMGDTGGALVILQEVAEAQPRRTEVWLNLATAYLGIFQTDAARNAFEKALSTDPRHHDSYVQLLALLVREGDLDDAQALLERVRINRPEDTAFFEDLYRRLVERVSAGPGESRS